MCEVAPNPKQYLGHRGGRDQFFLNEAIRGEKWETRRDLRREMGKKWETIRNLRREMVVNGKQYDPRYIIFQQKNEKNREKIGKTGEKTLKKTGKTGRKKNGKLQEIQKRDFDEVPGNAENGNEFSARFREMLKTETETRSSRMSRNKDSRAKSMYRPTPTWASTVFYLPGGEVVGAGRGAKGVDDVCGHRQLMTI